jgi:hypothetical protein
MMRRGISNVVVTVLLVLLGITAVGVIAAFIIPFVKDSLDDGTACLTYRDYYQFEEEFKMNCRQGSLHGASVRAAGSEGLAEEVSGMRLTFSEEGSAKTVKIDAGADVKPGELTMLNPAAGTFSIPGPGEVRTYVHTSSEAYTKVKVFPVLKTGKVCDVTDEITLKLCVGVDLANPGA